MKPKYHLFHKALAATVTVLGTASLHAQTAWDGGGGNTDYSNNLNWDGDIIPGDTNANGARIGDSTNHTVVYNTATSYTSTGTGLANSLLVGTGTNGVGSLTLNGNAGTLTFGGDAYGSAAQIGSSLNGLVSTGTVTVSAGKLAITGGVNASMNLGVRLNGSGNPAVSGTLLINGGTVDVNGRILMGANSTGSIGLLTLSSGTLDMKRANAGFGADLGMIRLGTGNNTVNLDGGTVIFSGFHTSDAASARSNIFMNGTTLRANVAIADLFNGTTTNANYRLKSGGLVVDTNNFNVTVNDALTQETGHTAILRKEGLGLLTITGAQANRTGTTTVNGGTLRVSGGGSLGTGATTVSGSGSILDLDRNDTWGGHSLSAQALTIQTGGLVTNGTAITNGFNTVQTLALNGGELRVTGTARALTDLGATGLFKFEAYGIRDSVTVTGTTASSITNPTAIANAGINIGGFTNLGSGVGSAITFNVADVTNSSAPDLTVSAVLKNNYDNVAFNPLSNGLTKTGAGTMVLSTVNRYTGATAVDGGTLLINGSISTSSLTTVAANATIGGTGTVGALTVQDNGTLAPGVSPGTLSTGTLTLFGLSNLNFELDPTDFTTIGGVVNDLVSVTGNLTLDGILNLTPTSGDFLSVTEGNSWRLFNYSGTLTDNTLAFGSMPSLGSGLGWSIDTATSGQVNLVVIPEPSAALLVGLGSLALLRRRR